MGTPKNSDDIVTKEFVAPSSSGLVRMRIEEIIEIYSELPVLIDNLKYS